MNAGIVCQALVGGFNIENQLVRGRRSRVLYRGGQIVILDFNAWSCAMKKFRSDGRESNFCETFGDVADVSIYSKRFLEHENAGIFPRTCRASNVSVHCGSI